MTEVTTQLISKIAEELGLPTLRVQAAVELLDAGNTIPFIARYRKEATGALDEVALRAIEDALERAQALAARKKTVLKSIAEQDLLTDELRRKIEGCLDLRMLEKIYLPFKPRRRTRGAIARERGLGPLADLLMRQESQNQSKRATLTPYVDPKRDVPDVDAALQGALDIVAEAWSEDAATRQWLEDRAMKFGKFSARVKRGKKTAEGAEKFEQYFDRQEQVSRIPGHRVLAMLRGAAEGILNVSVELDGSRQVSDLRRRLIRNR